MLLCLLISDLVLRKKDRSEIREKALSKVGVIGEIRGHVKELY